MIVFFIKLSFENLLFLFTLNVSSTKLIFSEQRCQIRTMISAKSSTRGRDLVAAKQYRGHTWCPGVTVFSMSVGDILKLVRTLAG